MGSKKIDYIFALDKYRINKHKIMQKFKTTYIDKNGSEESFFISNGSSLYIKLRNVEFKGISFSSLEPVESNLNEAKKHFELNEYNNIIYYVMHITIPIKIKYYKECEIAYLNFVVDCRNPNNYYIFKDIELNIRDEKYHLLKNEEIFEYVLIRLQKSLPKHIYITSCISCKYGNYNPCGQLEYGGMDCFRKFKSESKLINDKESYFEITENKEILTVQETHWCNEYEELTINDWNYNDWQYNILITK
jgi:hypothetical protein